MSVLNSCCNDSISFTDHSSFLHFPSPFDDDVNASSSLLLLHQQQSQHDLFLHDHHIPLNEQPAVAPPPSTFLNGLGSLDQTVNNDHVLNQRKRGSSKRDRHSKINTLHGPRDRRMRLSLPVAKEFFGLQDMLGVDKASKTVEWLLFQARHAIKKLSRDHKSFHDGNGDDDTRSPSSVSDGEVVSGIIDETTIVNNDINSKELGGQKTAKKEKRSRVGRKMAFHPFAREWREKNRARARARTREKQLQIEGTTTKLQDVSKIISSSWMSTQQMENNGNEEQLRARNEGTTIEHETDDCLMITGRWSPSNYIYYNSLHNNNNGSSQEHPFGDFQFFGKPWEPYNNHSIR